MGSMEPGSSHPEVFKVTFAYALIMLRIVPQGRSEAGAENFCGHEHLY